MKILLVIVTVALLATGGWFGFQRFRANQAQSVQKAHSAAADAKQRSLQAANEVKQRATLAANDVRERAAQAAAESARREIEGQLKPMHVTSIMPGQPGIVIIDKKEYAEGENLTLPQGGKRLQVTQVRDDGILLAYNGQTFRLDPPAAPDLDALRKKR